MYKNLVTYDELRQIIENLGMSIKGAKKFNSSYYFQPIFKYKSRSQSFIVQVIFKQKYLNVLIVPHMAFDKKRIYLDYNNLTEIEKQSAEVISTKNFFDEYIKTIVLFAEKIKQTIQENCKEYKFFRLRSLFENKLNIKVSINWSHKAEEYILK